MVKGGHCIDITYYHPNDNISTFYEEDQSYCHKRSCAKKTFRIGFHEKIWSPYHMAHELYNITHTVFVNPSKYERLRCFRWFHFGSLEKKIWKQKSKYHYHWRYAQLVVALKSLPQNWNLDTKHLPRNLSACHGIYGSPPEYMGTYYMYEDYNIWGISHVPVSGGVSKNITFSLEIIPKCKTLFSVWTYVRTT